MPAFSSSFPSPLTARSCYAIGELAALIGVRPDTLRYYEKQGLLKPRRRGRGAYRSYDETDLRRLRFIRQAQRCGFPLDEVKQLLDLPQSDAACCSAVRSLAVEKKLQLEARIRTMQAMSRRLDQLIAACKDDSLPLAECPILHGLEQATDPSGPA